MSKIRTAALGAVFTVGLATFAGAQVPAKPDSAHRGMRDGAHRGMMDGQRHRGMKGRHGGMQRQGEGRLMADLNLTDAQKARIRTIHEKYQPQFKTLREQGKAQFEALRGKGQARDTSAAARQRFQQQREQFSQRATALRTQQQNEIRAILTADQRAKWEAAATQRKARLDGRRERMQKQRRGDRIKSKA